MEAIAFVQLLAGSWLHGLKNDHLTGSLASRTNGQLWGKPFLRQKA
jgi:hypothetical protein